jgi:hypothetical protein
MYDNLKEREWVPSTRGFEDDEGKERRVHVVLQVNEGGLLRPLELMKFLSVMKNVYSQYQCLSTLSSTLQS